jgi:LmbE family N-acetylglucosaminyl deacetylase
MVVAAHPDDETVGAAGLLLAARPAVVVHVTDGAPRDPSLRPAGPHDRAAYARLRREEALAALAEAGLGPADVVALGAVDQEAVRAIVPVARELAALVRRSRPRLLVLHPVEGGHPDHDAAAFAARAACALLAREGVRPPPRVEMTSYHRGPGGLVTGAFLDGPTAVHARPLAPAARASKARMIARYASQREVLAPFRADVERFRRAPPLAPGRRPHPGALHYEVMGWARFEDVDAAMRDAAGALGLGAAAWA